MAKEKKKYAIEIHRFKDTGKYYTTITLDVEATNDTDAVQEVRRLRNLRQDEMIWLVTGKGLTYEVPRLLVN